MTKTDYLEAIILNWVTRGTSIQQVITGYAALLTGTPTDSDAASKEATYTNYTRTGLAAHFGAAATAGTIQNTASISFPQNAGAAQIITYVAIFDALTNGNMLYYQALPASVTINTSDTPRFAIGSFILNED